MNARTLPVALALAALVAVPAGTLRAQAQQQVQQQTQVEKSGTLASIALSTNLVRADIVGDTFAPSFAGKAKIALNLMQASKEVCYEIEVSAVENATDAQIFKGAKAENGAAVLPIPLKTDSAVTKGCVKASDELFADISANPANYYVQVNSKAFPRGAIRGQLTKSEKLIRH